MMINATLSCLHVIRINDRTVHLDRIPCDECEGAKQTILFTMGDEWRVKCGQCHYGRNFGTAPLAAGHAAKGHNMRMGHDVSVLRNGTADYVISNTQPFISVNSDDPPF